MKVRKHCAKHENDAFKRKDISRMSIKDVSLHKVKQSPPTVMAATTKYARHSARRKEIYAPRLPSVRSEQEIEPPGPPGRLWGPYKNCAGLNLHKKRETEAGS